MDRYRHRHRRERPRGRHQPHRRRRSAHRHAVQHRQAVRRPRRAGPALRSRSVAAAGKWRDFLPQTLVDATNRDGKFYAVPINVHGENWLFYNKALFKELGAPDPDTWEHFFEAADKLKAAGKVALALGGQPWQERLMFNNVLTSIGGGEIMVKAYGEQDIDTIRSDAFRQAADTFAQAARLRRRGQPRPQLERRDQHGADRPGRHAVHGRLGEGRVRGGRQGGRRRLRMHSRRAGRDLLPDRRRRLRLPQAARTPTR